MRARVVGMVALVALALVAGNSRAEVSHTFKHDQFSDSIQTASQELSGIPLSTQAGFVKGEAYGSVFRPMEHMYPVKIQGIDVVMAAMPNDIQNSKAHAVIEVYFFDGTGPDPGGAPVFTLSTHDVFNQQTMEFGSPLEGNTAMSFEFDWEDGEGHPPMLTNGNFLVAIRFSEDSAALKDPWGTFQCDIDALFGLCGCQRVGTLHDQAPTAEANVLHIIYPLGECGGVANQWMWIQQAGVTGDAILRARATVQDAPCVPNCLNKECGDDGCDGSCGVCDGPGETCVAGVCDVCDPDCDGLECGDDGCDGSCGECADDEECVQGVCEGDEPCEPVCEGKVCGADQCGSTCGECPADKTCNASGQCVDEGVCDPVANCFGKTCGTDGCGGVCGVCQEGYDCVMGACTEEGGGGEEGLKVSSVSPGEGCNDDITPITIFGAGFVEGEMTVYLAGKEIQSEVQDSTTIMAIVPDGLATGRHDLTVSDGTASKSYLPGFKVLRCGDTGCGVGDSNRSAGPGLLLLLAGLALAWRRVWV